MNGAQPVALRLRSVSQLFHTLDPAPFREGDLDAEAEAYILDLVADLPSRAPVAITIHLPAAEAASAEARGIPHSIRTFFDRRAARAARELRENFRSGRRALVIGVGILALCMAAAAALASEGEAGRLARIVEESLIIIGWVALWQPAGIFLYDWIPIARRLTRFRRLAGAEVTVAADAA